MMDSDLEGVPVAVLDFSDEKELFNRGEVLGIPVDENLLPLEDSEIGVLLVLGTVLLDFEDGLFVTSVSCNEELPEDDFSLVAEELACVLLIGQ